MATALVDTGATHSYITLKLAKALQNKIKASMHDKVIVGGGSDLPILGKIKAHIRIQLFADTHTVTD